MNHPRCQNSLHTIFVYSVFGFCLFTVVEMVKLGIVEIDQDGLWYFGGKVPFSAIPFWDDQDIVLYHGTLDIHVPAILQEVNLSCCRDLRYFGRGVLHHHKLITSTERARDIALQTHNGNPAVVQFTIERNELARLDGLFFFRGTTNAFDYWSFVRFCRTTPTDHNRRHASWYDIVGGPVAGSWKKQTIIPDADQISFHTAHAASILDNCRDKQVL